MHLLGYDTQKHFYAWAVLHEQDCSYTEYYTEVILAQLGLPTALTWTQRQQRYKRRYKVSKCASDISDTTQTNV